MVKILKINAALEASRQIETRFGDKRSPLDIIILGFDARFFMPDPAKPKRRKRREKKKK